MEKDVSNNKDLENLLFSDSRIKIPENTPASGGGDNSIAKKAANLGLEIVLPGIALERDEEISKAMALLNNKENVMF